MLRTATVVLALAAAGTGVAQIAQAAQAGRPHWRIVTLRVHGAPFSYAEPDIVVGPNRRTMVIDTASANTGAPPTYWVSRDGGRHWSIGTDFDQTGLATGDADALIGPDGYMYALNLGYSTNPKKAANPHVVVFRSRTGHKWSGPASFPTHGLDQPDRPWLVANPRHPANVDVVYSEGGGNIFMWRSFNHGAKFTGPIPVSGGHNSQLAVALSSRPLFDPARPGRVFMFYETLGAAKPPTPHGRVYEFPLTQIWLATSTNSGKSWKQRRVLDTSHLSGVLKKAIIGHALITSAIDQRGRLFVAFSARPPSTTKTTIYLMHSTTHGRTWSAPARVKAPTASNVMPALAVSSQGSAYLSWYGSTNKDFRSPHATWREMFARTADPLASKPRFEVSHISGPQPVHIGGIDTAGSLGSDTGANWSLRDFQAIAVGPCGAPHPVWADDNGVKETQTASPVSPCS
jgi:hypothetical protein